MNRLPLCSSTIAEMKAFLKEIGVMYTLKSKKEYQDRIRLFKNVYTFPWRIDQKRVIETFLAQQKKYYVVNGIFGCGKTSMIMGIHVQAIVSGLYNPTEAMFLSFNVCIKNELIQKLRNYGMSSKTDVRTFDSIIYEICKKYEYPYMDLPNYEGKRKLSLFTCCRSTLVSFSLTSARISSTRRSTYSKPFSRWLRSFSQETYSSRSKRSLVRAFCGIC